MTIGRPRQFDEDQSLDQAMLQFWQHGYASTSMRDLTDSTGLSKSSLYNSFGNKSALFSSCLARFKSKLINDLEQQLSDAESGLQFIRDLLEEIVSEADNPQRYGCFLVNTASELAGQDRLIAQKVDSGFLEIRNVLASALTKAQRTHEISSEIDNDLMADHILSVIIGLRTMVKSGVTKHRLQNVINRMMQSLS